MKISRQTKIAGISVAAVIALGIGTGAAVAALGSDADGSGGEAIPTEAPAPVVKAVIPTDTNVRSGTLPDGRSYGPAPVVPGGGQVDEAQLLSLLPDLVSVEGDHGVQGYASADVVYGTGEVKSPEDASAYLEERAKNGPISTPVFDVNGKKVDTFTVQDSAGQ